MVNKPTSNASSASVLSLAFFRTAADSVVAEYPGPVRLV